jgi:hypothetical protein
MIGAHLFPCRLSAVPSIRVGMTGGQRRMVVVIVAWGAVAMQGGAV